MKRARFPAALLAALLAGAGATRAAAADAVQLPPMVVSESRIPWRLMTGPGIEVLSRSPDAVTTKVIRREQRLQELLRLILPEEMQPRLSLPRMIVLTGDTGGAALSQQIVTEFDAGAKQREGGTGKRSATIQYLPNLLLTDWDVQITFAVIDETNFREENITLAADSVRLRLQRHTPALPEWAVEGFMALFATMHFQDNRVALEPLRWTSAAETERLRTDAGAPRTLLPVGELVAPLNAAQRSDADYLARWRAQAALFLRWALDGKDAPSRAPFWKFVARSSEGPPTEALFEECFGLGSADVRDRLSDYLPLAVQKGIALTLASPGPAPISRPRDATPSEIARIKGDWERLAIGHVAARNREFVPAYRALAQATLQRGMEEEQPDPRVAGVLGLMEFEAGRLDDARPHLEAAAAANVTGPRVYVEVARLRLREAQARAGASGANRRFSPAEADAILRPLAQARTQAPPIAIGYALAAQTWFQSNFDPEPADYALLDEGLRLFPRDLSLLYSVALLRASRGAKAEAAALLQRGLALDLSPEVRTTFERLRATLEKKD